MIFVDRPTWKFWVGVGCIVFLIISWVPEFLEYVVHQNGNDELRIDIEQQFEQQLEKQQQALEEEIEDLKEELYKLK